MQQCHREPAAAREIVALCGYLPLAIRIAGARLREHPGWSLASFAERLKDQSQRLTELSSHGVEVRTSFALSYDARLASPICSRAGGSG
jgi:hypothetical protein